MTWFQNLQTKVREGRKAYWKKVEDNGGKGNGGIWKTFWKSLGFKARQTDASANSANQNEQNNGSSNGLGSGGSQGSSQNPELNYGQPGNALISPAEDSQEQAEQDQYIDADYGINHDPWSDEAEMD